MKIILCVDDNQGMAFGNMRQSRDRLLVEDIISLVKFNKLYISKYSLTLFENRNVTIDNDMLKKADENDYCFVELSCDGILTEKVDEFVIYRWNRSYPCDSFFNINLAENGFIKVNETDIAGNSHEKITRQVYKK